MIAMGLAFVRRDFLIVASYRFAFAAQVVALLSLVGIMYLVAVVIASPLAQPIAGMSDNYFDFLIAGMAFTDVFTFGLGAFPRAIRDGQNSGTLEYVLLTPSRLFPVVLYSSAFGFLQSLLRLIIMSAV